MNQAIFNKLLSYLLYSLLANLVIILIFSDSLLDTSIIFLLLNGSLSLCGIIFSVSIQKLSINLIYSFFNFFFFFIIPLLQLTTKTFNYFLFGSTTIALVEYSCVLIFIFNLLYYYRYYANYSEKKGKIFVVKVRKVKIIRIYIYLLFMCLFTLYVTVIVGWQTFFFRSYSEDIIKKTSLIFALFYANFISPLTFFIFVISLKLKKQISLFPRVLLGIIALLYNNPVATPRFYFFTILIVYYALFLMKREKKGWILISYLISGLFLSFFFSSLRYIKNISEISTISFTFSTHTFVDNIHFDAFEVLMMSVKYVETKGLLLGENLLGALFFFIPRAFWSSKPEPTGIILLSHKMNSLAFADESFSNISCPLVSEIYISFGVLGVIIFSYMLGSICSKLDLILKDIIFPSKVLLLEREFLLVFLSIICGMTLFILRGTLMVAFAYSIGIIVAYFIALKICSLTIKR